VNIGAWAAGRAGEFSTVEIPDHVEEAARRAKLERDEQALADEQLHKRRLLVRWGVPAKDVERISVGNQLKRTKPLLQAHSHREGILVLGGSIGCGKTTAAAWWLAQPGPKSTYVQTHDPLFIPTYRFERLSRYSNAEMARVERARRLVVDDIGTEFLDTKGNFIALLRGLIDSRYADSLPMIITTNLESEEFSDRYGARSIDRLREVGRYVFIKGASLRGK
jgi:DNA replication protein DnaC